MGEYIFAKYIRLSIEDTKSESMSIENQHLILDRHIERLNIPNCRVLEFEDNGYSGTNFERPRVQELLELVQTGGVNCVIVKDFSRFGRNSIEMGYYLERVFPLCHVRFISVDDYYDSAEHDGDTGGLDVAFKFLIHEQYSKDLSQKITASKHQRMKCGEHIFSFFGYRKVSNSLVIDEAAADTVRRIYALLLEGKSYRQIAETMYAEKRKTPTAHKSGAEDYIWSESQILKILRDEQYSGTYVAGKTRILEVGSGKKIKVPKENWVRIENHHPPVVDRETFDAVQNKLNSRSVPLRGRKVSTNERYANRCSSPLKGRVVCAACGHVMRLSMTKNTAFHCHHTLAAPDAVCHKLKINASELETAVLQKLHGQAVAVDCEDGAPLLSPLPQHRLEIVALEDEKRILYEQFVEGAVSRDDFMARNSQLSADVEKALHKQAAIETQFKKQSEAQSGSMMLMQAVEALKGSQTLTEELVTALIDKVKIAPDGGVVIEWKGGITI